MFYIPEFKVALFADLMELGLWEGRVIFLEVNLHVGLP